MRYALRAAEKPGRNTGCTNLPASNVRLIGKAPILNASGARLTFFVRALFSARCAGANLLLCGLAWGAARGQVLLPVSAQAVLPDAPSAILADAVSSRVKADTELVASLPAPDAAAFWNISNSLATPEAAPCPGEPQQGAGEPQPAPPPASRTGQQPKRILGFMPNYRAVSSGTVPPPPTMQQNFKIATRQAFDGRSDGA